MSHAIEAAKSSRAVCATCGEKISKGVVRVAELYQDATHGRPQYEQRYHGHYSRGASEARDAIQRFHHLECAVDKHPAVVATALKRPHDASLIPDRADMQAGRRRRRGRAQGARRRGDGSHGAAVEAAAEDPNLTLLLEQLADKPDDPDLIAIVGDLYQSVNDPRGELISIQLATRNVKRERGPEVANSRGRTRTAEVEDTTTKDLGARRDQLIARHAREQAGVGQGQDPQARQRQARDQVRQGDEGVQGRRPVPRPLGRRRLTQGVISKTNVRVAVFGATASSDALTRNVRTAGVSGPNATGEVHGSTISPVLSSHRTEV